MSTAEVMRYLFNENPLVIDRELAVAIGLNEAMILQQMQYWIKKSEHKYDSKTWIYNSVSQWKKQFPFFSESTIDRAIKNLKAKGLLFIGNYNKDRRDRTRWYSINYLELDAVMKNAISQNDECNQSICTNAISQNDQMQQVNLTSPLPEITTENTLKEKINKKEISQKLEKTAFPENLTINESNQKLANELGLNAEFEFGKFRDRNLAVGGKYINWDSAFGGWLRKAYEFKNGGKYKPVETRPKQTQMSPERRAELDRYLFMHGVS